jgi:hypothetical protein
MANYMTLEDIYAGIEKNVTDFGQGDRRAQLLPIINMVYLNEVMTCDDLYPMHWMLDPIDNVKTKSLATVTGITKADPGVVTAATHGFDDGDIVQFGTVTGMAELNNRIAVVTSKAANTFQLYDLSGNKINTTNYAAVGTAATVYHRGVTLSKAIKKVFSFAWHGYNGQLEPISPIKIEKSASWMDPLCYSKPTKYLHKPYFSTAGTKTDRLLWFTLPDTNYAMRLWGALDAAPMAAVGDVPQLPFEFHPSIVSGSISRLVQYGNVHT